MLLEPSFSKQLAHVVDFWHRGSPLGFCPNAAKNAYWETYARESRTYTYFVDNELLRLQSPCSNIGADSPEVLVNVLNDIFSRFP